LLAAGAAKAGTPPQPFSAAGAGSVNAKLACGFSVLPVSQPTQL